MIPPATRAANEEQATACLEAAETHRVSLLAVAVRYAGSAEGGMDLFQQTCLNCHDAIQRNGFAGNRYEFYLLASIKNLAVKEKKQRARFESWPEQLEPASPPAPVHDGKALLAEQLAAEVRRRCTFDERISLRLHGDGYSYQQIADLTGAADRFRVRRQLDRLKDALRETFRQAWDALGE